VGAVVPRKAVGVVQYSHGFTEMIYAHTAAEYKRNTR
jgi:hypothetical protein